jgi:hypothetical protein
MGEGKRKGKMGLKRGVNREGEREEDTIGDRARMYEKAEEWEEEEEREGK